MFLLAERVFRSQRCGCFLRAQDASGSASWSSFACAKVVILQTDVKGVGDTACHTTVDC